MNAKFVFAVLIALQVSLALAELPDPPQDLVDKVNHMKAKLSSRFTNLMSKLQANENPAVMAAKEVVNDNQQTLTKVEDVASAIRQEMASVFERAEHDLLAAYAYYLRSNLETPLQKGIDQITAMLDQIAPANN